MQTHQSRNPLPEKITGTTKENAGDHPIQINTPLVNEIPPPPSERELILLEAIKCVTKDRNATHGDPEDNFAVIADFWTTYLKMKGRLAYGIDSTDVAAMMVLMKVSRIITSPEHKDHWVDIAGYAACGGGIASSQKIHQNDATKNND